MHDLAGGQALPRPLGGTREAEATAGEVQAVADK